MTDDSSKSNEFFNKKKTIEIKINYIKNDRETSEEENNYTLAKLVSLFAQIGIAEMKQCNI
jgi:hypothetical protein